MFYFTSNVEVPPDPIFKHSFGLSPLPLNRLIRYNHFKVRKHFTNSLGYSHTKFAKLNKKFDPIDYPTLSNVSSISQMYNCNTSKNIDSSNKI